MAISREKNNSFLILFQIFFEETSFLLLVWWQILRQIFCISCVTTSQLWNHDCLRHGKNLKDVLINIFIFCYANNKLPQWLIGNTLTPMIFLSVKFRMSSRGRFIFYYLTSNYDFPKGKFAGILTHQVRYSKKYTAFNFLSADNFFWRLNLPVTFLGKDSRLSYLWLWRSQ